MATQCNGVNLPVTIQVTIGAENRHITSFTSTYALLNGAGAINEFEIKENLSLSIGFYPDSENDYDPSSYLKIDSHTDNEQQENGFTIPLGKSLSIFNTGKYLPFPFRLGYTVLKLVYKNEEYLTKVSVTPIHYTKEQVAAIHNYLEQQVKSICYDYLVIEGLADQFDRTELHWYREYGKFHQQNESEIVGLFSRIKQDELKDMVKEYIAQPYLARTDAKGFRQSLIKGLTNQKNPYINQKAHMVVDEKLSTWLKYTLYRWHNKIEDAILAIEKELGKITENVRQQKQIISSYQLKQSRTNIPNASKIYSRSLFTDQRVSEQRVKELTKYQAERELWLKSLYFIKHRIIYLLNETELINVPLQAPKGHVRLKGQVIKRIQRLYEESESFTIPEGTKSKLIQVPKPTWQVFEYFVVSKTLHILSSLNYNFRVLGGLDYSIIENIVISGIPESSTFTLENDTHIVKLAYDNPLPRSEEDAIERNHFFYTFSNHNRPDLRVELYEKTEGNLNKFLGLIVIEIKFRKFDSLYNLSPPTDTMVTLSEYGSIKYRSPNEQYIFGKNVDGVICVYAGSTNGKKVCEFKDNNFYVRLFPQLDNSNSIINLIGEDELKKLLSNWLQSKIQSYHPEQMPASL